MTMIYLHKHNNNYWQRHILILQPKKNYKGDSLLAWFIDYLSCRSQKVMFKDQLSSSAGLNAGVPQGSVLGPLLFLIYVNDVAENMVSFCRLFAYDNLI
jgi:hypothetical protein